MSGDVLLTVTILALDMALFFTLAKPDATVSPVTAGVYALFVGVGAVGFMQNDQAGPFVAQVFGAIEWVLMVYKSIRRRGR